MPTSDFNSAGQLNQLEHDPDNHAKRVNNYIWNGSAWVRDCLLYTSPSPRDVEESRMPSSA